MKRYLITLFFTVIITVAASSQFREVWMLGPMVHLNFGNKEVHFSYGIELSYWNYQNFPYSVNGGIDFEKRKIRFYSEAQTGIGLLGISAGPVIELNTINFSFSSGFQSSVWANYFGGFDFRYKRIGKHSYYGPGAYFKVPFGFGYESDESNHHWDWED